MSKILFTKNSKKELNKLTKNDALAILKKINQLKIPLPSFLNIKKLLSTKSSYRVRIGKMRVIFEIEQKTQIIWIRKIGYRKDVYKFLSE